MYTRLLLEEIKNTKKSLIILGPRQVGKSTLIHSMRPDLSINLANESEFFHLHSDPSELERRVFGSKAKTIFIDEIQRIPRMTNTIQDIIDNNPSLRFFLSGSSARKLRKGKANLLPGRLLFFQLAPLAAAELGPDWDIDKVMRFGCLPGVLTNPSDKEKKLMLKSYTNSYLKEEIMAESLVRQVDGFVRFLSCAAADAGSFLDYSKIAKKSKVPRQSVVRHFEILEDTLIARKIQNDPNLDPEEFDLVKHPRFYFFDLGVLNTLRGTFELNQERLGFLFEHMVFNQIVNSATGRNLDYEIYNFRTRGGLEVDFILKIEGTYYALECKAGKSVTSSELNPIKKISKYYPKIKKLVIYQGTKELKDGDVWILPFQKALKTLGL